ncbi:hypothetical protein N7450_009251 [Penicillium hetheringtonii]|uniref:Zn(2)-C6 fungal-type domain-containing protein n=1 Tax=Penicillium hetheringtonii TaxID=911720 RepID=A0AAD6GP38_9EURO|nr:hypothetical protein N7450_009251 [Penicillium hetheringtonii]
MTSVLQSPTQTPRTNSLGRSKSPCQHCQAAGISCDRARPQCFTCIRNHTTCPGYKLDLRWQRGVAAKGNLAGFSYPAPKARTSNVGSQSHSVDQKRRWRGKTSKDTGDRHFKFVDGKLGGKRGHKAKTISKPACSEALVQDQQLASSNEPAMTYQSNSELPDTLSFLHLSGVSREPQTCPGYNVNGSMEATTLAEEQICADQEAPYLSSLNEDTVENICDNDYYDQYICAIPLTADCFLNPFRVSNQNYVVSQHLLHAVMATSLFHLNRLNESKDSINLVDSHRSESLGLYLKALNSPAWQKKAVTFLDTALLLMYLDSAQSALGLYHIHLQGVRSIIECSGAREELVLPLSYLENILRYGHSDGWSYLELTGCLEEFVVIMAKLASLAQQHETAREKENLYFDMGAVDEVERTLRGVPVPYPHFNEGLDEETLDFLRDRYHCIEAWRNALLIYIERVFRWDRTGPVPPNAKYHARSIMEHARCIRKENNFQKQILLPIFLAGTEVKREEDRDFVREYCSWWTRLCGSKMFIDASSFCEEAWIKFDNGDCDGIWWGSIIDKKCAESGFPICPQILLG